MSEKQGIERFTPAHSVRMDASSDGLYVRYEDHLAVLGEATKAGKTVLAALERCEKHAREAESLRADAAREAVLYFAEVQQERSRGDALLAEKKRAEAELDEALEGTHPDRNGAAEQHLRAEEQHRLETQRECIAAKQELQGLREAVEAAVEHHQEVANDWRRDGQIRNAHGAVARRLQALLDTDSADEAKS